jgi:uncharacterized membrane protein
MSELRWRREYLDWMRGLAVLVMIEAHVIDSWTRVDARQSWQFMWAMILGGFGAPLFLFLAGVSVALSAGSKFRRSGDARSAATAVMGRGLWVFGLAFLFRLQAWILGMSSPGTLLKVDILNIMGPAIVAAAALWGAFRSTWSRAIAFGCAALALTLLTPIVRTTPLIDSWPDALVGYIRPIRELSNFCIFPWAGFVLAGGAVGVLIDALRTPAAEARLSFGLFAAGAALALAGYGASFLPSPYAHSDFWGSSPAFFFLRTGIMMATIGVAYSWQALKSSASSAWSRIAATSRWSPLQQLGRTSLFIYWIHVEMVYGIISIPIHKGLSHQSAWLALGAFTLFMLACSIAKDRFVGWRAGRNAAPAAPAFAPQ